MYDLQKWRKEFPSVENSVYLLNHSLGPMPRGVSENLNRFMNVWNSKPATAWPEHWWTVNAEAGNLVADVLNAPNDVISMHPNVTSATATAFSCFRPTKTKDTVIYTDMHFPSIKYLLKAMSQDGFKYKIIKTEDGKTIPPEKIVDAIDDKTLFVPISYAFFRSSYLQDVKPIIEKARSRGAYVILDVYQAAGVVPLDVLDMGIDIVTGGFIKWFCGGSGAAYLYVRPGLAEKLKPKVTGWMAHSNPFLFADEMQYSENVAYRYLNGTPQIPGLYAAKAGLEIIGEIGVENIREHSLKLTQRIIDSALESGIKVNTPQEPSRRGGTVVLQMENSMEISQKLIERNFLVDWRPDAGIRISPHFFSTEDEIDAIMNEIRMLM